MKIIVEQINIKKNLFAACSRGTTIDLKTNFVGWANSFIVNPTFLAITFKPKFIQR